MRTIAFHNLGCKVNGYETDVMIQKMLEKGYRLVPFEEQADIYVVNTCTVTNIADRKSRQMLHRAKKRNPGAVVVAVGCYVETDEEGVRKDPAIDLAIGNNRKGDIARILEEFFSAREGDGAAEAVPAGYLASGGLTDHPAFESMTLKSPGHTRAYVKIQDGCNQFCSYCIIPYARGRVRSRDTEEILEEIRGLAASGVKEVVLTGIHIGSYGLDWENRRRKEQSGIRRETPAGTGGAALQKLLLDVAGIDGIERIRLGSLEPTVMTEEFVAAIAAEPRICPHFHLSLQSGCDATLRRMNRHYTAGEFLACVQRLRRYYDRPALTTDVIVGFPGETEQEFRETVRFLEKVNFYEIHVFKYSMRHGTVAAAMPEQVPEGIKAERSAVLQEMTRRQSAAYRDSFLGEEETMLAEEILRYEELTRRTQQSVGTARDEMAKRIEASGAADPEKAEGTAGRTEVPAETARDEAALRNRRFLTGHTSRYLQCAVLVEDADDPRCEHTNGAADENVGSLRHERTGDVADENANGMRHECMGGMIRGRLTRQLAGTSLVEMIPGESVETARIPLNKSV